MANAFSPAPSKAAIDCEAGGSLSDRNFNRLCEFVHRVCGIALTPKKRTMVEGRLRRRMRALNITGINDYCRYLFDQATEAAEAELVHFIDVVTTNKTDFFREPGHFTFLRDRALPEYQALGRSAIKVWSAACSIGAEAYTVAMVIDHFFEGRVGYSITATDICTDVLARGTEGIFPDSMLVPIPDWFRRRYVQIPTEPSRREFRIVPKLRARVSFSQLNLMDDRYGVDQDFDLIFLRNVLIYFDRQTQAEVLNKLCHHLRPGGYLFVGHSESLAGARLPLAMVANTIFQRQ